MISKTIGCRGTQHFQTNPHCITILETLVYLFRDHWIIMSLQWTKQRPGQKRKCLSASDLEGQVFPGSGTLAMWMWVKMEDRCGTTDVSLVWANHPIIEVPNIDPYPCVKHIQ